MLETESILNSRPPTNVAEQPDNEELLTPNHFLIQRPFNSLPPGQFGDQQPANLKTWKNTQKLMNHIWRRLVKEYLPIVSRRSKWSNSNNRPLKVDEIVWWVLKDQKCIHQSTEPTKAFIQQRYHVINLRKELASVRFHFFLCRRFDTKNIQPILAPLPSFRFPIAKTQFPFANSGVDFFGPFYIEDSKGIIEKHYGLIFTCMVTRAFHLETCPDLNTDTFLNAFRRFCSRQCQPQLLYSDNEKTFIGASEELKKTV